MRSYICNFSIERHAQVRLSVVELADRQISGVEISVGGIRPRKQNGGTTLFGICKLMEIFQPC